MLNTAYYPCLQIRNSALVCYMQSAEPIQRSHKQLLTEQNLIDTYKGDISKLSKKNIARAVQLLVMASPWKWYLNPITNSKNRMRINFITLTFSCSELINLKEGYNNSLKPFLRWLKEVQKCELYVWKAEYQKRGQLHYHITTNKFIHHTEIRNKWNYIQKQNGYLQEYWDKYGHYDANSTDVHAVYKIKDIESYLIKYVSKSVGENKCRGKIWGCSEKLRGKQYYTLDYVHDDILDGIHNGVNSNELKRLDFIEQCSFWKIQGGKDYGDLLHDSFKHDIENYIYSDYKKTIEYINNKSI